MNCNQFKLMPLKYGGYKHVSSRLVSSRRDSLLRCFVATLCIAMASILLMPFTAEAAVSPTPPAIVIVNDSGQNLQVVRTESKLLNFRDSNGNQIQLPGSVAVYSPPPSLSRVGGPVQAFGLCTVTFQASSPTISFGKATGYAQVEVGSGCNGGVTWFNQISMWTGSSWQLKAKSSIVTTPPGGLVYSQAQKPCAGASPRDWLNDIRLSSSGSAGSSQSPLGCNA
jgi:hypothetical protein